MTPAEHYLEAERLLSIADQAEGPNIVVKLQEAQVHATLATAGSAWSATRPPREFPTAQETR